MRTKSWWLIIGGGVAAVVISLVVVAAIVLSTPSTSCGCSGPPDERGVIPTVENYVSNLVSGQATDAQLTDERLATLRALAAPGTTWDIVIERSAGYDSDSRWLVLGVGVKGDWAVVSVRDRATGDPGTVDPQVDAGPVPTVLRGGSAPVFGSDEEGSAVRLVAPATGLVPLEYILDSKKWVHTGDLLTPGRYLVVLVRSTGWAENEVFTAGATWLTV